jgi:hypothetical protein
MKTTEYRCIKTYKGKFGTYYEGKFYSNIQRLDSYIVYVCYHKEDMIDYQSTSKNKLYDILPGMQFALNKNYSNHLFFNDYFSDIKDVRKKKLQKLNESS